MDLVNKLESSINKRFSLSLVNLIQGDRSIIVLKNERLLNGKINYPSI